MPFLRDSVGDSDESDEDLSLDKNPEAGTRPANNVLQPSLQLLEGQLDGTNEQSTGSTERLRRQIDDAERALCSLSPRYGQYTEILAPAAPASSALKRRHTSAFHDAGSDATPSTGSKRSKTLKVYGSSSKRSNVDEDRSRRFERPGDDDSHSVRTRLTSPSFSEHSAGENDIANHVSTGSRPEFGGAEDFLNHEPNEMFGETGSTVVDTSSLAQQLVDQHVRRTEVTSHLEVPEMDAAKSSSFPWSPSQATMPSAIKEANDEAGIPVPGDHEASAAGEGKLPHSVIHATGNGIDLDEQALIQDIIKHLGRPEPPNDGDVSAASHQPSTKTANPEADAILPASSPSSSRKGSVRASSGKQLSYGPSTDHPKADLKRKSQQNPPSDSLNSDDIQAIGLPKEEYKPRPSRRRATVMVEAPIDYSVRPERAAKMKRAKTSTASTRHSSAKAAASRDETDRDIKPRQTSSARKTQLGISQAASEEIVEPNENISDDDERMPQQDLKPHVVDRKSGADTEDASISVATPVAQPSQSSSADGEFKKPQSISKSSKKARRCNTTIFEDHVKYKGSQRVPTLAEQQALRESSVSCEIEGHVVKTTESKRGRKVVNDEDDEDELALHCEPKAELRTAGTRRKRGRPAKGAGDGSVHESETPLHDPSEAADEEPEAEDSEDDLPKKRARGRPPKPVAEITSNEAAVAPDVDGSLQPTTETPKQRGRGRPPKAVVAVQIPSKENIEPPVDDAHEEEESITPLKPSSAAQIQTPDASPQQTEEAQKTQQKPAPKPSPTSHSPINKSSGQVALRVGLSKRQRIPPLHRNIKPPATKPVK